MAAGAITLDDKCRLAREVGKQLSTSYGKRTHYAPPIVKAAMRKQRFPSEWDSWALSLFCTRDEFNAYHDARGEHADFSSMRSSMLAAINPGPAIDMNTGSGWSAAAELFDLLD